MYRKIIYSLLLLSFISSCSDKSVLEPEKEFTDINELIKYAGKFENSNFSNKRTQIGESKEYLDEGGISYSSNSKKFITQNSFEEIVLFNNNYADILYPSALLQGENLKSSEINPLGDFPRNEVTLTLNGGNSIIVTNPNKANITNSIKENLLNNIPSVSNIEYNFKEMYSFEQSLIELGINADWLIGSVKSKFSNNKSLKKKSILLYFKQIYYTISSNSFPTGKDFFKNNIDIKSLQTKIKPGNPPCYISQVNYGRIILVKVTSTDSYEEMKTKFEGAYKIANGNFNYERVDIDEDYEFTATIIGGTNLGAAEAIVSQDIQSINQLIKNEANPSQANPGAPISFTIRSLLDNSIVKLGSKSEFTTPNWKLDNTKYDFINLDLKNFLIDDDGTWIGSGKFTYEITLKDNYGNTMQDLNGNELFLKSYKPEEVGSGDKLIITNGDFKNIPIEKNNSKIYFNIKVFYHNDNPQGQLAAMSDNSNTFLTYPPKSFGDYKINLNTIFSDFKIIFNFAINRN